jgi:hypothetical protein
VFKKQLLILLSFLLYGRPTILYVAAGSKGLPDDGNWGTRPDKMDSVPSRLHPNIHAIRTFYKPPYISRFTSFSTFLKKASAYLDVFFHTYSPPPYHG